MFRKKGKRAYYKILIPGFLTFRFILLSYQFSFSTPGQGAISLLSYNVKFFRVPGTYNAFSPEMIDWVVNDKSSIKCLQEYSTNKNWEALDITKKITDQGYESYIFKTPEETNQEHNPGMATFSKYPILNSGIVENLTRDMNAILFTDLLVKKDTIRVYNVHLTSYSLKKASGSTIIEQIWKIIQVIKKGVIIHEKEIDLLLAHVQNCPYPFVVAGDFNESPYSFNYFRVKRKIKSAFNKGSGFGLTYIDPPMLLRIDHIFHDDEIDMQSFKVDYDMPVSDHYPIRGYFGIK